MIADSPMEGARATAERRRAARCYADGAVDAAAVRSAIARLEAPVLLVAGEVEVALPPSRAADHAALFPAAELVGQPGAGHFPWLDDPRRFMQTLVEFLPRALTAEVLAGQPATATSERNRRPAADDSQGIDQR